MRALQIVAIALTLGACGAGSPSAEENNLQPEGWDQELALHEAEDLNTEPNVVEVNLVAQVGSLELVPGTSTPAWTYNGSVPGPLIRAHVGDTLIVHFKNELPEPTTLHWHGLRVPAVMDGVPEHSQSVVPPGGTFDYSFTLPDAGLYWYHPHYDSAAQVGNGLYGAIVVEDPAESIPGDELVLVLSDMGVMADGSLAPPDISGVLGTLFGREGNVLLTNGRVAPTLHARSGKLQRWRLLNAAKSRYFQLALEGHTFLRIGADGGLSEFPVEQDRLVIAPSERLDVLVVPHGPASQKLPLRWVPYDRGFGATTNRPEENVLFVDFADAAASKTDSFPTTISRTIAPLDLTNATPVWLSMTQDVDADGKLILAFNHIPVEQSEPLHAAVNETQIWTVRTDMEWSHPFHLHGFFFQVLDENGQPRHPIEWRDTVDVPYKSSVQLAVKFDDRPGMWMFHCHILDHADGGMMGMVHLMP